MTTFGAVDAIVVSVRRTDRRFSRQKAAHQSSSIACMTPLVTIREMCPSAKL
jgi:hypothetical protein